MAKDKKNLFVYGSLKKGYLLHNFYLSKSKFIAQDSVKGEMYDLGSYPAYIEGEGVVHGEVYEVGSKEFESVKNMEESAGYETINIKTKGGMDVYIFSYKDESIRSRCKLINNYVKQK